VDCTRKRAEKSRLVDMNYSATVNDDSANRLTPSIQLTRPEDDITSTVAAAAAAALDRYIYSVTHSVGDVIITALTAIGFVTLFEVAL